MHVIANCLYRLKVTRATCYTDLMTASLNTANKQRSVHMSHSNPGQLKQALNWKGHRDSCLSVICANY